MAGAAYLGLGLIWDYDLLLASGVAIRRRRFLIFLLHLILMFRGFPRSGKPLYFLYRFDVVLTMLNNAQHEQHLTSDYSPCNGKKKGRYLSAPSNQPNEKLSLP